jgi:ABC-type dipeptide/oligopeptide/nickel transport system permease subunit
LIAVEAEDAEALQRTEVLAAPPRRGSRLLKELLTNPMVLIGAGILLILTLMSLAAPLMAGHDPNIITLAPPNQAPSGSDWFGTDYLARDLWSRVVYGGRVSLPAGLGVVLIGAGIGIPLGLVAGYVAGALDDVFMRFMDIVLAFPGIVLAILVVGILSPGLTSAVIAIGVTSVPFFARFARGSTLSVRENDYVVAAHVLGTRKTKIVRRHILPNILGPLIVLCATTFGYAILATTALSYLGLGSQPPTSDWGSLMKEGYDNMFLGAHEVIFPGLAILLTVMAVNLLADGLSNSLNTRA